MAKLALCEVSELIKQVLDCLSGENGEEWAASLRRFLRKENPWPLQVGVISGLWQTVAQIEGRAVTLQYMLDTAPKGETHTIDWYLEDQSRIPDEWKGRIVIFRNSEFRDFAGARCAHFLDWNRYNRGRWERDYHRFTDKMGVREFLAVSMTPMKPQT